MKFSPSTLPVADPDSHGAGQTTADLDLSRYDGKSKALAAKVA
jgi:hypothetical protein